jgi:hypothetical protein
MPRAVGKAGVKAGRAKPNYAEPVTARSLASRLRAPVSSVLKQVSEVRAIIPVVDRAIAAAALGAVAAVATGSVSEAHSSET